MHRLRARLAETLMSTGDQSSTKIFTVDQTHFAADALDAGSDVTVASCGDV